MYLPLDIPSIKPNDPELFLSWFLERAKTVNKVRADVAGDAYKADRTFLSVNSPNQLDDIWEQNKHDVLTEFPEIAEGIKALPFDGEPEFSLWSSERPVGLHRDQSPWEDMPSSFRIMLYDNNPRETLFIRQCVPGASNSNPILPLARTDTNVFGWNNVRAKHGSSYHDDHIKILMIFTRATMNLEKCEDLLERSVQKYGNLAHLSKKALPEFIG
jgi:hypothetical protein